MVWNHVVATQPYWGNSPQPNRALGQSACGPFDLAIWLRRRDGYRPLVPTVSNSLWWYPPPQPWYMHSSNQYIYSARYAASRFGYSQGLLIKMPPVGYCCWETMRLNCGSRTLPADDKRLASWLFFWATTVIDIASLACASSKCRDYTWR